VKPAPEILLGDLARAAVRLEPGNARTVEAIASMLGLDHRRPTRAVSRAEHRDERRAASAGTTSAATEPTGERPPDLDALPLLRQIRRRRAPPSTPWSQAAPLPPVGERHLYGRLPYEPLFEPRWTRELLYAAIGTDVPSEELDVEAAVERVASGRPLEELPRRRRRSATFGVQLLVDGGVGMEPFRRDCVAAAAALRRVVGRTRVSTLHFEATLRGGVGAEPFGARSAYAPPESGTPVLLLSDLGMVPVPDRPPADEWIELAGRLARRGSALVAFVPYPADRWPVRLARAVALVQWDRVTTVASANRRRAA
jgi:hypothetical protein